MTNDVAILTLIADLQRDKLTLAQRAAQLERELTDAHQRVADLEAQASTDEQENPQ